jgi:hypothetical protein
MTSQDNLPSASDELSAACLPDSRLNKRLTIVADALEHHPDASFPDVFGSDGPLEACYRLLRNPRVSPEAVIEPHFEASAERCRQVGHVLLVHDTSWMIFSRTSQRDDLYELGTNQYGYLSHACLAITADGLKCPLGLLSLQTIDPKAVAHLSRPKRRKHPDSPMRRWLKGVQTASSRLGDDIKRVHLMDREGDDYELMSTMIEDGEDFVIRLRHDRENTVCVDETTSSEQVVKLCKAAATNQVRMVRSVELSKRNHPPGTPARTTKTHPERQARLAELSVRTQRVRLKRPSQLKAEHAASIELNLIHILEEAAPEGEDAVEWFLLTSLDMTSDDQLDYVINSYVARWVIEEFFKVLKTSCSFERRQLHSLKTCRTAETILMPVAWRLLLMRHLSRMPCNVSASTVLSATQINVLRKLYDPRVKKKKLPADLDIHRAMAAIAALGGHTRPSLPIGWLKLYRGYRKILEAEAVWLLMSEDDV